jgi:DNA-binding HxlR family transcriptional regulator
MQDIAINNSEIETRPGCVAEALAIVGNKWTALIVMALSQGCGRFSALEVSLSGISPRTLSQRLDYLEENELITKKSFAEVPPRVEYALTDKGRDLLPILKSMADWEKNTQRLAVALVPAKLSQD